MCILAPKWKGSVGRRACDRLSHQPKQQGQRAFKAHSHPIACRSLSLCSRVADALATDARDSPCLPQEERRMVRDAATRDPHSRCILLPWSHAVPLIPGDLVLSLTGSQGQATRTSCLPLSRSHPSARDTSGHRRSGRSLQGGSNRQSRLQERRSGARWLPLLSLFPTSSHVSLFSSSPFIRMLRHVVRVCRSCTPLVRIRHLLSHSTRADALTDRRRTLVPLCLPPSLSVSLSHAGFLEEGR